MAAFSVLRSPPRILLHPFFLVFRQAFFVRNWIEMVFPDFFFVNERFCLIFNDLYYKIFLPVSETDEGIGSETIFLKKMFINICFF
jgi:hypothetical protein